MGQPAAGTVQIQVNGEQRVARAGVTIADLLRDLDIKPDRVAVEVNLEIVDRREFERRGLGEGDRVEIISFIGGGSGQAFSDRRSAFSREMNTSLRQADC
ncbi:MAG: sulfur carrier protein ThiS [Nitrospirota bacterium]